MSRPNYAGPCDNCCDPCSNLLSHDSITVALSGIDTSCCVDSNKISNVNRVFTLPKTGANQFHYEDPFPDAPSLPRMVYGSPGCTGFETDAMDFISVTVLCSSGTLTIEVTASSTSIFGGSINPAPNDPTTPIPNDTTICNPAFIGSYGKGGTATIGFI